MHHPRISKGTWSSSEDASLLRLVEQHKPNFNWKNIAEKIEGRNPKQCRERWTLNLDPTIRRGPWTAEEDALVVELLLKHGREYDLIAKELAARSKSERTKGQIKTRYRTVLQQQNPELMRQVYSVEAS